MISRGIAALAAAGCAAVAIAPGPAAAQEAVTVQGLLDQGYELASSIWTANIGPGLFLQKGASLYLCFVQEKPEPTPLTTRYCKEVH
jgi:hypothetical protein